MCKFKKRKLSLGYEKCVGVNFEGNCHIRSLIKKETPAFHALLALKFAMWHETCEKGRFFMGSRKKTLDYETKVYVA